ncbi:hypothetical protein F3J34_10650 [Klebsiella sp. Ap-873]|nr:hypothetical protein [Klebsiella sp. Ap-873]
MSNGNSRRANDHMPPDLAKAISERSQQQQGTPQKTTNQPAGDAKQKQ